MITADRAENPIWPTELRHEPATYVSHLIVSRAFAGRGLGAALLDWAGLSARRRYGARWVRVDVWTTNTALHTYYEEQGFEFCGFGEASGITPQQLCSRRQRRLSGPPRTPCFAYIRRRMADAGDAL